MSGKRPSRTPIRDAATLIILRRETGEVVMGERSQGHVFYPEHYVFPGGRVDAQDGYAPAARELRPEVEERLRSSATARRARALALAAVRETFEEAGLVVGEPVNGVAPDGLSDDWRHFYDSGYAPALDKLTYIHRAVTPPGRPRRFNARFFVIDAEHVRGDLSEGSGELLKLHWVGLADAQRLKLRPITALVLKEIEARLTEDRLHDMTRPVPVVKTLHGKRVMEWD